MGAISAALHILMVATREETRLPGLLSFVRDGRTAGFNYVEEWKTEEDLIAQLRSDRFAKLGHLMEGATESPTVEFSLPGGTRGIDYAEEARGRQGEML
jgi:hypothetical protein